MIQKTSDPKFDIEVTTDGACLVNAHTGVAIPPDEPVFIFRAKDRRAVDALKSYLKACEDADHIRAVEQRIEEFEEFSRTHSDVMKEPDTQLPER